MKYSQKLILILFVLWLICFSLVSIRLGVEIEREFNDPNKDYLGCWRSIENTQRSIIIKTHSESLSEIAETMRHELCHEIYYRNLENKLEDYDSAESEVFAQTCYPYEYMVI